MALVKDRVRQLLKHYGILFRELCTNELPLPLWGKKLHSPERLMEFSGEILL
ncbi:MAG: hypothetical protein V1758_11040 [Pseudomonadota bacterium]